jgi:hypothetical protein
VKQKAVKLSFGRRPVAKAVDFKLMILMPLFNDWRSLSLLLLTGTRAKTANLSQSLLRTTDRPKLPESLSKITAVNRGIDAGAPAQSSEQRAIAVGLSYLEATIQTTGGDHGRRW